MTFFTSSKPQQKWLQAGPGCWEKEVARPSGHNPTINGPKSMGFPGVINGPPWAKNAGIHPCRNPDVHHYHRIRVFFFGWEGGTRENP